MAGIKSSRGRSKSMAASSRRSSSKAKSISRSRSRSTSSRRVKTRKSVISKKRLTSIRASISSTLLKSILKPKSGASRSAAQAKRKVAAKQTKGAASMKGGSRRSRSPSISRSSRSDGRRAKKEHFSIFTSAKLDKANVIEKGGYPLRRIPSRVSRSKVRTSASKSDWPKSIRPSQSKRSAKGRRSRK